MSGRKVEIHVYTRAEDADKVMFAIECVKAAMRWDEKRFGREYDLDVFQIVAVSDFNMGAMENKGLNIFNTSCVLATPHVATDDAYERVEAIIAHEYFHNWSGNRVTCRDWFQLSLKEGFTVFRDAEFTSDLRSRPVKRIQDVDFLRTHQFAEDAGPTSHPVRPSEYEEISNFYTVTIYEKGAEVVRMLETLLGRATFRKGSDLYFDRFDGQAATCDDFVQCMQEVSGIDLTQFKRWYSQAGTPKLSVSVEANGDGSKITVHQVLRDGQQPFHMPLPSSAYTRSGQVVQSSLNWTLTQETHEFELDHPANDLLLSINDGFAAPVIVDYPLTASELAVLAESSNDGFNRWDAGRRLISQAWIELINTGDKACIDPIEKLFRACLTNASMDTALMCEVLSLPDDSQIVAQFDGIDPIVVRNAAETILAETGKRLSPVIQPHLIRLDQTLNYQPGGPQAANRKLWATLMTFLAHTEDHSISDNITRRFVGADNLTDRLNCLNIAGHLLPQQPVILPSMLNVFYTDWGHEPLLVDQWFQVQAKYGSLADIKALIEHEDFTLLNPNRARSVIGPFTRSNPKAFHAEGGYRFLGELIGKLDAINPQIASRLVMPLTRFKAWTPDQQSQARSVLEDLADRCQSSDCLEVINKALH